MRAFLKQCAVLFRLYEKLGHFQSEMKSRKFITVIRGGKRNKKRDDVINSEVFIGVFAIVYEN